MTTFEKCKHLRMSLLTRTAEAMVYSWPNEYKIENINSIHKSIESWEKQVGSFKINPRDLSYEEMRELWFMAWGEDNPMRLIPIWLFPFLEDRFEFISIDGEKGDKLSDMDKDHRYGSLAYGVIPIN